MKSCYSFYTVFTAGLLLCSGCVTGIIEKPDLEKLGYDKKGILRYKGEEVEIRSVLSWYEDMLPDSPSEWGFTVFTAGITAVLVGGVGGGGSDSGGSTQPVAVPSTTSSSGGGGGGESSPSTVTTSSGGGGGGSAPPPPPPPPTEFETPN